MDQRSITPGLIDEVRIGRENVTIRYPVGLPGSSFGRFCGFTPNNASASFSVYSAASVQLYPLIVVNWYVDTGRRASLCMSSGSSGQPPSKLSIRANRTDGFKQPSKHAAQPRWGS